MKRNHATFTTRIVTVMLTALGLLFSASATATAGTATASEVSRSSTVHVAELSLAADPKIAGPFLTRRECAALRALYVPLFDWVSDCFFDPPTRAYYFTYEDFMRAGM